VSDATTTDEPTAGGRVTKRTKVAAGLTALTLVLGTLGWFWWQSLLPGTYSVMSMGYADYGGGVAFGHESAHAAHGGFGAAHGDGSVSVADLVGPDGPADVQVSLVARAEKIELSGPNSRSVDGYTLNHQSPGPEIRVKQGQLLEVTLVNESGPDGVSLHWHGVDLPNGEDGVAGVTQDAVERGEQHVYRFVAEDPGTYWYHSHQVSDEQVRNGLFGALVVLPAEPAASPAQLTEGLALVHSYRGFRTVNGTVGEERLEVAPGDTAVVRVVNTNNGRLRAWVSGASYRVLAVDARPINQPEPVNGKTIVVAAGGRADVEVKVPETSAVRLHLGGDTSLVIGPRDAEADTVEDPERELDLMTYGSPAPVGFDPSAVDRDFEYRIGRRLGFLDGKPGFWWSINGHLFPDVPIFMVEEGDVVRMTVENNSGGVHPMHLHGHHALVLSRNGKPSTGSPWWTDSLDVEDGETYVLAFVADNPGIWMDHCHNLPHASEGLMTHLMYAGVTTPYQVGGDHHNNPE
jgi:FtsP/CotA-like multicopper oxidase with cupredoxin domain